MPILNKDEIQFLDNNLKNYYTSDDLKDSMLEWAHKNKITKNNYEQKLKDDFGSTVDDLCRYMTQLEIDERIKKDDLWMAAHKYKKFERWVIATINGYSKKIEELKEHERWKYRRISIRKLLGVGILERSLINSNSE